jgi:hypothetical protein
MIMPIPFTARSDPQPLIHRHESQEPNQNSHTKQQVPVRLNHHHPHPIGLILAQKNLRQQVKQRVAQQPADGKSHHDGQGRRVDVGWD